MFCVSGRERAPRIRRIISAELECGGCGVKGRVGGGAGEGLADGVEVEEEFGAEDALEGALCSVIHGISISNKQELRRGVGDVPEHEVA